MNPQIRLVAGWGLGLALFAAAVASPAASARPNPVAPPAGAPLETPQPRSRWQTQWGGFNNLLAIQATAPDTVWAVGSNVVKFDGERWVAADRRDMPSHLKGVSVTAAGDGWAVGDDEEMIPIRGGVVGESIHVAGYRFHDVAAVSATEAWAVAWRSQRSSESVVLKFDGTAWSEQWSGSGLRLTSIWMHSSTEGWAAGSSALHFDGRAWTEWALPVHAVVDIAGTAPDNVWAVGGIWTPFIGYGDEKPRRFFVHFDGRGWRIERDEPEQIVWAFALRGDEGIAVSVTGEILSLKGTAWTKLQASVPVVLRPVGGGMYTFVDGMVTAATYVPGAPYALVTNYNGWVYRVDGEEVTLEHDASTFHAVAMLDAGLGWAVGRDVLQYDGERWRLQPEDSPLRGSRDLASTGGREAWAVGPGPRVLRQEAGAWLPVDFPYATNLERVTATDSGEIWALGADLDDGPAGDAARLFARAGGGGWRQVWAGPGAPRDMAVFGATGLVATDAGIWLSHDLQQGDEAPTWRMIRDEAALSVGLGTRGEVWAGDDRQIWEFDGSGWRSVAWTGLRVWAFTNGEASSWAVTDFGLVLEHRAGTWGIVRGDPNVSGFSGQMYGLRDVTTAGLPGGGRGIWAVGQPDTIVFSTEAEAGEAPVVTPEPTMPPHNFPTTSWTDFPGTIYFPSVSSFAINRSDTCQTAASLPGSAVEDAARRTARYYAEAGPQPEPRLERMHMLTAAEADAVYGTTLAGSSVNGRQVQPDTCLWWAAFEGWFDCRCDAGTAALPGNRFEWTRLDLALFPDDAAVLYEAFSEKDTSPPPNATTAPATPTSRDEPIPTPTAPFDGVDRGPGGPWGPGPGGTGARVRIPERTVTYARPKSETPWRAPGHPHDGRTTSLTSPGNSA